MGAIPFYFLFKREKKEGRTQKSLIYHWFFQLIIINYKIVLSTLFLSLIPKLIFLLKKSNNLILITKSLIILFYPPTHVLPFAGTKLLAFLIVSIFIPNSHNLTCLSFTMSVFLPFSYFYRILPNLDNLNPRMLVY